MSSPAVAAIPLRRNADFMRLWAAATVSAAGSQVTAFAMPITAILVLRAGALEVGLLMAATYLPLTLFGLFAGAWADRVRRRPLLIAADLVRAAVIASIPIAYASGVLSMAHLYAVAFVAGTLTVVFDVAHGSYLPELVDRDSLLAANSRLQVSEQGASVLGPAVGALLVTAAGAPLALLVDAISFLVSAGLLMTIAHREETPKPEEQKGMLTEVAAGVRYVASRPSLRAFAGSTFLANLFLRMISTVLVLHLVRVVGLAPSIVGVVLSIGEAGFLAGAFAVGAIGKRASLPTTLAIAVTLIAVSGFPIALAPAGLAVPMTAAGLFVYGFAAVTWTVSAGAYRQSTTPSQLLGRTGSVMRVAAWGPIPIASLAAGAVAGASSTRTAMLVAAIGGLAAALPVNVWRLAGARD
ncbi:MAG TPA: MFS transporter [Candidatus Dormibacteraeota bacterium]|nr:MFS transporter [Candidatus Dormibacteraeota bacterium]